MSHPVTMKKSRLTLAVSAALAGISFAQPTWSACTVDGSTFTVNTTTDVTAAADGLTTFREAVILANASPDCDMINFDPALNGQTITYSQGADVDINGSVNIIGPGPSLLTITNTIANNALNGNSGDIDISGITFDGSDSQIKFYGAPNVSIDNIIVKNTAYTGITVGGTSSLSVTNTAVSDNAGHGLSISASNLDVTIDNCTVTDNNNHGIYLYNDNNDVSIDKCIVTGNNNSGISINNSGNSGPSTITIKNSTIDGQNIFSGGAGIYISTSYDANGAGDSITIDNSTISNNTSSSFLQENAIGYASGSGIQVNFSSSTIYDYDLTITQCTISGNTTSNAGGGIYIGNSTVGSNININHSTITNNTAEYGGGLFNNASGADVNLSNSVISGNTANSANLTDEDIGIHWDTGTYLAGNVIADYSFIGVNHTNVTDAGTGSILNGGDAMLGALADAGGTTLTHYPLAGSQVIDAGDPAIIGAPATDQRGSSRIINGTIDIGAIESGNLPPTATNITEISVSVGDSISEDLSVYFTDPDADTLSFSQTGLPSNFSLSTAGVLTGLVTDVNFADAPYTIAVTASDGSLSVSQSATISVTEAAPTLSVPASSGGSSSLGVYLLGLLTSVLGFARYRRKLKS